jgi:hypothetical protein
MKKEREAKEIDEEDQEQESDPTTKNVMQSKCSYDGKISISIPFPNEKKVTLETAVCR